jgi:hypothetical protein
MQEVISCFEPTGYTVYLKEHSSTDVIESIDIFVYPSNCDFLFFFFNFKMPDF